jgi:hypothetical protein
MATKELDVYKEWLGITDTVRPLNHYQLLRLKQFEDDAAKVREHYRKMNAHVRKYSAGEFGPQSQALLNELAKAMLCLTDSKRKSEYDASLGRKDSGAGKRRSFEELLIARKITDPAQLAKARTFANTVGIEMHDAVVQQKIAKSDVAMQLYAESIGLPYVDLADIPVDETLVPRVPAYLARQHSCAPVMIDDGQVLMATPHPLLPDVEEELRLRIGMPVRTVLCTPSEMNDCIQKYYPKDAAAAEMAAKSKAPSAAPTTNADGSPGPTVRRQATPEERKQQRMVAFMAFNFSFMATVIGCQLFMRTPTMTGSIGMGALVGAAAAGIAYAVVGMKR